MGDYGLWGHEMGATDCSLFEHLEKGVKELVLALFHALQKFHILINGLKLVILGLFYDF